MGRPARPFVLAEICLSGEVTILQSGKEIPQILNVALIRISVFGRLLFARSAAHHFMIDKSRSTKYKKFWLNKKQYFLFN